jgi:nitrogen fixation protein FixH
MNNRLILLGIMFMVSLFALPLTGCDTDSGMVLVVKVDTPKDGSTVNTPTVTVSGRVVGTESKGAKVSINNIDAPVTDGKYSANVTLKEGKNVINIVAKSGQAAPEETVTVTYKK